MTKTSFLLGDFYTITSLKAGDEKITAEVKLNPAHPIFKGHFEQMPVVPGVCQTQMIKELLEEHLQKPLRLSQGDNIKFMGMIIPASHPDVQIEITYKPNENKYQADAKLFFENTTFTKFKGSFINN